MRILRFLLLISVCSFVYSQERDSTGEKGSTLEENIALTTMTGVIIPLAIAGTVISIVPPSMSILRRNGVNYGGMNFESGIGWGEKHVTGIFSDWRVSFSYSYVISSHIRDVFRAEVKRDFHDDFIDRRKIFLLGVHFSAGVLTDFPNSGFTVGSGAWIKSPWLSYFGFFPQHTIGFSYRYNRYFNGKYFQELSAGITSAFTL